MLSIGHCRKNKTNLLTVASQGMVGANDHNAVIVGHHLYSNDVLFGVEQDTPLLPLPFQETHAFLSGMIGGLCPLSSSFLM